MDWKLIGSCIVAAEFGFAVLYCVRVGIRALRKQSATSKKHGHTMSRGRFCRIAIDGKTIQWTHGL